MVRSQGELAFAFNVARRWSSSRQMPALHSLCGQRAERVVIKPTVTKQSDHNSDMSGMRSKNRRSLWPC